MAIYTTNGKAVKALTLDSVMGPGFESGLGQAANSSPLEAYRVVPFVRRATRLRANAVSKVPWSIMRNGKDVSDRPEWAGLVAELPTLLWRTEAALCLSPYGATWRRQTNAAGLNPTPEWLLPKAIWPYLTAERGLEYFRYVHPWGVAGAGMVEALPPEDVVYFWYPNLERVNWPGVPPGITALAAAGVLSSVDSFLSQYFARGAIKSVILSVPPEAPPDQRKALAAWWKTIVAGVRNAWQTVVVSSAVTPVVLGDGLKDINNDALVRQYRQDTAASFDIPETMLMQGAANHATAISDRVSFYEETVFPECELIRTALNSQWLGPDYDAELVYHAEQTEARQDAQVQQASAITDLVGQPVLTVDEGRAWLGMDPMGGAAPDDETDEAGDYAAMEQDEAGAEGAEVDAEVNGAAQAKGIMGYHIEAGVVSRNEARAALGLPPEDETDDQRLRKLQATLSVAKAAIDAGYSPESAWGLVGLPKGETKPPPPAPFGQPPTEADDAAEEEDTGDAMKRWAREATSGRYTLLPGADGRKAERAALYASHAQTRADVRARHAQERLQARQAGQEARRGAKSSRERLVATQRHTEALTTLRGRQGAERTMLRGVHQAERGRLIDRHRAARAVEVAELRAQGAVKALKAAPALTPAEQALYDALAPLLARYGQATVAAVLKGEAPPDIAADLQAAMAAALAPLVTAQILDLSPVPLDEAQAASLGAQYARERVGLTVAGLTETTREAVRSAVDTYRATPGMTRADLEGLLGRTFGKSRAETIAITSATEAQSAATTYTQAWLKERGIEMVRIWRTSNDDKTCVICGPLNGQPESEWPEGMDGPPAHVRCRCFVTLQEAE